MNIAQFSKISGVPVSTLHYYDKLALFSPAEKNDQNGYRDYTAEQLSELNKILTLRDSGIKLDAIKAILSKQPDITYLSQMLEENIALLEDEVIDRRNRIQRIQTDLFLLKNGGIPLMNEIIIKQIEPIHGVSIRRSYKKNDPNQTFDAFCEEIWQELEEKIQKYNISLTTPCMTRYFEGLFFDPSSSLIDLEIIEPVIKPIPLKHSEPLQMITLPGQTVVSAIHHGSLSEIGDTFDKMMVWLKTNHYEVNGPIREIYHRVETDPLADQATPVTELQIPITDG
ncbi:MerR family transcriptional regulator [Candidatus Enterococcus clewellii]|uniref:HTH merR-type domain-containing protein n=1 Tax=Candidatus Enterococcus clewellii TaxID=1834193 RepID=A0A242KDR1_9ENTE|nr:MerR family transcriptional regulator [Enterococcus sp. 9E7_DIV0242]OTP19209.1 hypothetical protein A5888_001024 [Enterococcus sp. 9E7_DIV0242]